MTNQKMAELLRELQPRIDKLDEMGPITHRLAVSAEMRSIEAKGEAERVVEVLQTVLMRLKYLETGEKPESKCGGCGPRYVSGAPNLSSKKSSEEGVWSTIGKRFKALVGR